MKVEVSHELTNQEAYTRVHGLISGLKKQYAEQMDNIKENWTEQKCDFSFDLLKFNIKGSIEFAEKKVIIHGKLPIVATPFKGVIENKIKQEAQNLLQ